MALDWRLAEEGAYTSEGAYTPGRRSFRLSTYLPRNPVKQRTYGLLSLGFVTGGILGVIEYQLAQILRGRKVGRYRFGSIQYKYLSNP
jgi:hypothetical protein